MVQKWLKHILLIIGVFLLIFISINIQKPFWQSPTYHETILNFQKDQDIFPYKIRTIWWNKSIILISLIERTIDLIWTDNFFYLPLICLFLLIKKRRWINLGLIIIGLILISIENDPNPGKYFFWLIPLFIAGIIK